MKKSQFIELVAEKAGMSKSAAARVVEAIFGAASGAISDAVNTAGQLSIPGFGKFSTKKRAARSGRNPRTGVVIHIPERTTVSFSPGKGLKERASGAAAGGARKGAKSKTAGSARKGTAAAKTTAERAPAKKTTAKKGGAAAKTASKSTAKKGGKSK